MKKYGALWSYVQEKNLPTMKLTFEEIGEVLGFPLDPAFLKEKKGLEVYGFQVGKISLKAGTVLIDKKMD